MSKESKILVSPSYGAGWSTWNNPKIRKFMLTYQPIIDYLEAGGEIKSVDHPLLVQLEQECLEKFGVDYVCTLGATDGLIVETVSGRFRIHEYDGSEDVVYEKAEEWYDL